MFLFYTWDRFIYQENCHKKDRSVRLPPTNSVHHKATCAPARPTGVTESRAHDALEILVVDPKVFQIVPLSHGELVASFEERNGRGRAPGCGESPEDRIPIPIARVHLDLPTAGADGTEWDPSHGLARFEVAFEKLRSRSDGCYRNTG